MPRTKIHAGTKIRLLRERSGLTLEACARRLALSPSYLSQLETNQRPLSARVLVALTRHFGVPPAEFEVEGQDRLLAELREAAADSSFGAPLASIAELKLAASATPALARQFLALHRAYRALDERLLRWDERVGQAGRGGPEHRTPYEEVRDFFHYRDNYVDELDRAAESLAADIGLDGEQSIAVALERALTARHGVRVTRGQTVDPLLIRQYDPDRRVVTMPRDLAGPTHHFQLAAQLAELTFGPAIDQLLADPGLGDDTAREVARVGLGNYAAGALLMPYRHFAATATSLRHDIEQLQRRYGASFEQICHRLSTLQRPGERGLPFYFVRVDQAGNITKRHSATRFQFARFGGACALWNVHDAFGHPGRILVQVAEMPDGVRYLSIGRSIVKRSGSWQHPNRQYAIGIGCEVRHADKVVYADGLALEGPAVPIGVSCRVCERTRCHQRAFPALDQALRVPRHERRIVPYTQE